MNNSLHNEISTICGIPGRRGRPKKPCSLLLQQLRSMCIEKENHIVSKRVCRPKKKPGRPRKKPATEVDMVKEIIKNLSTPVVNSCPTIKYSKSEKNEMKAGGTNKNRRQQLKSKCEGHKDVQGRKCKVYVPRGLCVTNK